MNESFVVRKSPLSGKVEIPPSKSHTIRAVAIGSLAKGKSEISSPLVSEDTLAAVEVYKELGAKIKIQNGLQVQVTIPSRKLLLYYFLIY